MCHLRQELRSIGKYGVNLTVVCPSFIKTGMFEGVRVPMFTTWLSQGYAADQVVKAVRRNQWRLRMPSIVGLLALIVALSPIVFYDFAMRITRALNALKRFRQTRVNPGYSSGRVEEGRSNFSTKEGRSFSQMHQDNLQLHHKHAQPGVINGMPFTDLQVVMALRKRS